MTSDNREIDIEAMIAEYEAAKLTTEATTTATTQEPPAQAADDKGATSLPEAMNYTERAPSLSTSLRALAASPALPELVRRLAAWIETLERRGL